MSDTPNTPNPPEAELAAAVGSQIPPPDWDKIEWRQLEAGERVERGDWFDGCRDGWRDDPVWKPATRIGEKAPDPHYPAHRKFRRPLANN